MQKPPSSNANRNLPNHLGDRLHGMIRRKGKVELNRVPRHPVLPPHATEWLGATTDLTGGPGTDGSNPVPSSGESCANRCESGPRRSVRRASLSRPAERECSLEGLQPPEIVGQVENPTLEARFARSRLLHPQGMSAAAAD
jgi:hypothetical protein